MEDNLFKARGAANVQSETDTFKCGRCKQRKVGVCGLSRFFCPMLMLEQTPSAPITVRMLFYVLGDFSG